MFSTKFKSQSAKENNSNGVMSGYILKLNMNKYVYLTLENPKEIFTEGHCKSSVRILKSPEEWNNHY